MKIKTDFWLTALAFASQDIFALDFLLEPDFALKERYDDNVRMQIRSTGSNLVSTISPGLMFGYLADDNEFKTNFKWNEIFYSKDADLDFSEKILNSNHVFRTDFFKTEISGKYAEESSINNQLDLANDPTLITESGGIQRLIPRYTKSISPSVTFILSERNSLQFGYNYTDVSFDRNTSQTAPLNYSDYNFQQISATATHTYTEKLSFNLSGAYSVYDSANERAETVSFTRGFQQNSKTLNYQAGLQYLFDEQTQVSVSAGIRDTETQARQYLKHNNLGLYLSDFTNSSNNFGHIFSASLNRKQQWGNFSINAGQQLNPASTGNQQTSTTFSARALYNLDERWSAGFSASYLLSESISTFNNNNTSNNRTYITLSPNIRWFWSPEANFDLSYSYREQDYQSNQIAIGNSVQLQFSYQPQINRQVK
ncbi:hypothetical protein NP603_02745 [Methylomonas sp. SURF-1]|uniref:TIGR03016 family PEP-CTERM system-associated outer membrane protein n=1 Tax=Methylomonas aurea TaxID=2952224 RepID=A0ABT1UCR3_9GAMM|nr:hypothetical protein [Methylomonas sp. SURF-1]MCQ8180017.1 hypothetical protein [Methylomonas sp. SURF-1]